MREEKDKILETANAMAWEIVSKVLNAEKDSLIKGLVEGMET